MENDVLKEILRGYELAQNNAERLRETRRQTLYDTIPRAREIDTALAQVGAALVRMALDGSGNTDVHALRQQQSILKTERAALLEAHRIPEDYLEDVYECSECSDTGFIENAAQCTCLKQKRIDRFHTLSSLKTVLERENFDTFAPDFFSEELVAEEGLSARKNILRVRRDAEQFVKDFGTEFENLLFYGPTGLGKTFLCHCIAKAVLDAGHTVLYVTAPRLFKLITDRQFNRVRSDDADERLDAVQNCDLLILDDLGAEFSTVVTDSALFDVLNGRLLDRRSTVISSNLSIAELEQQYTERIVSRLIGSFRWYKFFGEDIRVQRKTRALT